MLEASAHDYRTAKALRAEEERMVVMADAASVATARQKDSFRHHMRIAEALRAEFSSDNDNYDHEEDHADTDAEDEEEHADTDDSGVDDDSDLSG